MRVTGLASLARRGYLSVALRTDEVCRVAVSARMSVSRFGTASLRLPRAQRTVIRLRAHDPRAVARALRTQSRTVAVRSPPRTRRATPHAQPDRAGERR